MMKKILFLGRFSPPVHGAAMMNENYFAELSKDKNFYIKRIKINYSESLSELGKVNLKKFFGFFIVFFRLFSSILFFRPDIVYMELAPRGIAFYRDSIYVFLCKVFRQKIVFHFQAKGISSYKNNFSKFYVYQVLKNTRVIILSSLLYYDIREFVKPENVFVIPNAIPDQINEREFKRVILERKKNKKITLLFLSNMIESKGPIEVLKICATLKNKNIKFICNFMGAFSTENFKIEFFNKLKELNLDSECFFIGPRYGKEKFKILEKTDYLLLPTYYPNEVFPLSILEALMYGIPVLSYDNAAIKEIISQNKLGFVAKQKDTPALTLELIRRISRVKEDPLKIRQEFKNKYTLDKSIKLIKEVFK